MNSAAGLVGQWTKLGGPAIESSLVAYGWLLVVVVVGGQIGSRAGIAVFSGETVRRVTGFLVVFVGARILWSWLLDAASLDEDPQTWRAAAAGALGMPELRELVRLYPGVIASALAHHLRQQPGTPKERWEALEGSVRVVDGGATIDLHAVRELRAEVLARL